MHEKDIGRQPGIIALAGMENSSKAKSESIECDHIQYQRGMVYTLQDGERVDYPMHRVVEVRHTEN